MHIGMKIPNTIPKTFTPVLLVSELLSQQPPEQHFCVLFLQRTEGWLVPTEQQISVVASMHFELQHVCEAFKQHIPLMFGSLLGQHV